MRKILLLSLVFSPDGVSTAIVMTELALELQALGHEITILTTTPHYNVDEEARTRQPLQKKWGGLLFESNLNGMRVLHASMPKKGERVGARLLDYMRFHLISTLAGLIATEKYDVILAPSPPLTIGVSAWILRLFKRVPFIYNVQEIYPDVAVSLGLLTNRKVIWLMERLESFVYRRSRKVTVISEHFRQRLLAKGVAPDKLVMIPNFVDTKFIQPGERHNAFSAEHDLNNKFVVFYAGNIGLTQSFEIILAATKQVRDTPDIHFLIVGDGARRAWLKEQLADGTYHNVTLLPYQLRSRVPEMYATADVCLVPLKKGTAQETFPSKIYTIMAAKRAVIASADPESELTDLVHASDCGWAIPPDDATALANAVQQAYQSPNQRLAKAANGYHYVVANHSRRAIAVQYDKLLEQIS